MDLLTSLILVAAGVGVGIMAAIVGGASGGVSVVIADPATFNIFQGGAKKLAAVCLVMALVNMASYLKEHPVPDEEK